MLPSEIIFFAYPSLGSWGQNARTAMTSTPGAERVKWQLEPPSAVHKQSLDIRKYKLISNYVDLLNMSFLFSIFYAKGTLLAL